MFSFHNNIVCVSDVYVRCVCGLLCGIEVCPVSVHVAFVSVGAHSSYETHTPPP